jgi:hypothetical protein
MIHKADLLERIEKIERRLNTRDFHEKYDPLIGKRVVGTQIETFYDGHDDFAPFSNPGIGAVCIGILERVDDTFLTIRKDEKSFWLAHYAEEVTCDE